ncbi:hypothetical protein GJAV_G00177570 [Gymnothorax javanicus]|nr:hypothetical protein GJAV_G00177570 [Gymnothorax javanicus]
MEVGTVEEGEVENTVGKFDSLGQESEALAGGAGAQLFLDEASNQSRGDGSSSGFLGSPGEPDSRSVSMEVSLDSQSVSMEMGLVPVDRSRSNSLLTETDDSLPFDPSKPDGEKVKRRGSPGRSRVKQGRSNSFPGKRRPRGGGAGRGRGRARFKTTVSCMEGYFESMDTGIGPCKDDEEDEDDTMQNTVVLFSNSDKFVMLQDMCVVCGSFGQGVEGQLLACAQCAQCYHPYCVNSKISRVMLSKGWRCLECIVCEMCGKASDPARLLLCDDCDVSYHTYCLDPPLHTVPKGGWKCKWCVRCLRCGATSPGFHCEWQNSYTHCGPCASLRTCPVCCQDFAEEELLLQCQHCDRWVHAVCEGLYTEDEAEQASDEGFTCTGCSPYFPRPVAVVTPSYLAPMKVKEPEPQFYRLEGVWLTETGMALLRSISLPQLQKKRPRRPRLDTCDGAELREGPGEGCGEPMDCETKLEAPGSPDGGGGPEGGGEGGADGEGVRGGALEEDLDDKKKKRKPYRPGIGGFMVRQRKCNLLLKRGRILPPLTRDASAEGTGAGEGLATDRASDEVVCAGGPPETPQDPKLTEAEAEHAKKRRGKKRSKLEDMLPAYLQEAFFGKTLLDLSKRAVQAPAGPRPSQGPVRPPHPSAPATQEPGCKPAPPQTAGSAERALPSPVPLKQEAGASHPREGAEGTPNEVESQDSVQFFKKVLGSSDGTSLGGVLQAGMRPILETGQGGSLKSLPPGSSLSSTLPSAGLMDSFPGLCQSPFFDRGDRSGLFSPEHEDESFWDPPSTPATPSTPTTPTEPEGDGLTYNQRSLQRWEKDEELGHMSTISPVLYANVNFPSLKQDYPDWSSRCKQIMKIWRKISPAEKAPFLQKAKDNRATQRISRAQKFEEKGQVCRTVKTESGPSECGRPALHLQIHPPGLAPDPSQPSSAESPSFLAEGPVKTPRSAGTPSDGLPKPPPQSPQPHSHPSIPSRPQQADPFPRAQHPHFQEPPGPRGSPHTRGPMEPPLVSPLRDTGQDLGSGSPAGPLSPGSGLFKAPPTPRAHQGDPGSSANCHTPTTPSPGYESPRTPLSDLYAQPPSTPRPLSGGSCSPLPQQDPCCRVPSSPKPLTGMRSPMTPGALSSEPFSAQSPAMARFQSPDPCSRPPSRPQSREPLAAPLKPYKSTPEGSPALAGSPCEGKTALPPPLPPSPGNPFTGKPPGIPSLSRSPGSNMLAGIRPQLCSSAPAPIQPLQQPQAQTQPPQKPQGQMQPLQQPLAQMQPLQQPLAQMQPLQQPQDQAPPQPHTQSQPQGQIQPLQQSQGQAQPQPQSQTQPLPQPQAQTQPLPQPQAQPTAATTFPLKPQPPPGASDASSQWPRDPLQGPSRPAQEVPDLPGAQDPSLSGLSPAELEKHRQRQRLRELLIRQQMQRNSLRQEKEAAAANSGTTNWSGGETTPYQMDKALRPPPPYPLDRAAVGHSGVASMEDKLGHPAPPRMPVSVDQSTIRLQGPQNLQGFQPQSPFPAPWPGQQVGLQRFPQPAVVGPSGPRPFPSVPMNMQRMQGMPDPRTLVPVPRVPGPPPQFIELRHNTQRTYQGHQFAPGTSQPRPHLYPPQQDRGPPFTQPPVPPSAVPPTLAPLAGTGPDLAQVQQQSDIEFPPGAQQSAIRPPQPHLQPSSSAPSPRTLLQQSPQTETPAAPPGLGTRPLDLPEPSTVDPFGPKGLGPTGGDDGGEEEDDLATLDLGPDKGDDDLGNLDSLETADPHLDDLLVCDEFDLLAYTDPELDQGDPKDAFSDQLRLVEAEGDAPAPSNVASDAKMEDKPGVLLPVQDALRDSVSIDTDPLQKPLTSVGSAQPCSSSSGTPWLGTVKLEESAAGLGDSQAPAALFEKELGPKQPQTTPALVKDEVGEAVSMLLGRPHTATKSPSGLSTQPSDPGIPSAGLSYPHPGQADPHGLPSAVGQGSPAVDLDRVESSLEASELPLLIQDLLEHEKKELQKRQQQQQQLSQFQQGPLSTQHHGSPAQHQQPQGPLGQSAVQHQRLLGAAACPPSQATMSSQQGMMAVGQPGHPTLGNPPQQMTKPPAPVNSFFPDTDLDKFAADDIMDPIAKAKMVALKGIKRVMAQGPLGVPPGVSRQQVSLLAQSLSGESQGQLPPGLPPGLSKEGETSNLEQPRPNPLQCTQGNIKEGDQQQQYEEWLLHTQQLLQMQLKFLEEQIGTHRKSRKALCAKQRTAKKAGRAFAEADAEKLKLVTEQQSKIQKQLDQVRKQQKEHITLMTEYRTKQQQHQQNSGLLAQSGSMMPGVPGPMMMMGQQGVQRVAQQPVRMPGGGIIPGPQQGQPYPGPSTGYFPQGARAPDPRLMQERQMQLQQRMQLVQKMQQQQQGMMGQPLMAQQPPPQQQGMISNSVIAQQPQGMMPHPIMPPQQQLPQQGMMGNPVISQQQQGMMNSSLLAQQLPPQQPGIMANAVMTQQQPSQQQGMMANLAMAQQQRSMMGNPVLAQQQQGMMGSTVMAQPPAQQPAQQQGIVGYQGSAQQQQGPSGNQSTTQLHQNPMGQQTIAQSQGMMASQQGMMDNQQIMVQQHQRAQALMTQPGQLAPQQQVSASRSVFHSQQLQQQRFLNPASQQLQTAGERSPAPLPLGSAETSQTRPQLQGSPQTQVQGGAENLQQRSQDSGHMQRPVPQQGNSILLQGQSPIGEEMPAVTAVKQEVLPGSYMAQQGAAGVRHPHSVTGQNRASQPQQGLMAHPTQQEQQPGLLAQHQKQGMMGQRPGAPIGQIRIPVNLQAFIAQNPQLRHLTPNQQVQHIQALIAQRNQMQGRLPVPQGPAHAQNRSAQSQQMQSFGAQQQAYRGSAGHQVALDPSSSQQQGLMGQPSGAAPYVQQSIMGLHQQQQQQQQQQNMMGQPSANHQLGQTQQQSLSAPQQPGVRSPVGLIQARGPGPMAPQSHASTPASPHGAFCQNSTGDPLSVQQEHLQQPRHILAQPSSMFQPSSTQVPLPCPELPPRTSATSGPFQASPVLEGSTAGSSEASVLPHAKRMDSPQGPPAASAQGLSINSAVRGAGPFNQATGTAVSSPRDSSHGPDPSDRAFCGMTTQPIKQEPREVQCSLETGGEARTGAVKREANGEPVTRRAETGHLLLQKLLRTKNLQAAAQRTADSAHSEINGHIDSKLAMLEQKLQGTPRNMEELQAVTKKAPVPKAKGPTSWRKKPKKEDVGNGTEALMKQLKQELSLLPLMEPCIAANLEMFAPFGSSPADGKERLKGSFGSAVLDDIPDYYSQLLSKDHLSNPPTPPSSLPPTPPPSVHHKLLNGVTATEEELAEAQKGDNVPEAATAIDSAAKEAKSVDLMAALPTPPHNQNEDVRMESDEDSDAPDSVVLASSPESVLQDEVHRFPLLGERRPGNREETASPVIPIIPRASIPVFPKTEPSGASAQPEHAGKAASGPGHQDEPKSGDVSVTFTLATGAAKNLSAVMATVARLLQVETPSSYEVTFPPGDSEPSAASADSAPAAVKSDPVGKEEKADWLKQGGVSLPGCSLKKQMDILSIIDPEPAEHQDKPVQHRYMNNDLDLDVRRLPVIPVEESPPESPPPPSPPPPAPSPPPALQLPSQTPAEPAPSPLPSAPPIKTEPEPDPAHTQQADLNLPDPALLHVRSPIVDEEEPAPEAKKWKGLRWKRLSPVLDPNDGLRPEERDETEDVSALLERLRITLRPDRLPKDLRNCCFCHQEGDGATDGPGRLLNVDVDLWAHLNCALWSTEVYETQGGALVNVEAALRRGLRTRCVGCRKVGATGGCARPRCLASYHFACAIQAQCGFFKDKTMLCPQHRAKGAPGEELSGFAVFRRVYVERDELKQMAGVLRRGDRLHTFRVGGLIFHSPGQLLPSQMAAFHSPTAIFPVGYEATRIYWSTRAPNRRCRYRCRVAEAEGRPLFQVRVLEQGQEDLLLRDSTPEGIWSRIVEQVATLRKEASMLTLFTGHVKAEEMFGLTIHAVLRITESLPGVEACQNYTFRYGRHPLMELPLMINPTGCARSEPKILTHYKRPHTLTSTSMCKAYQSTFIGDIPTPYSKQFIHSKSSQYRRLKTEWKNNVYLARSRIQGLGLYAARDLEMHTMVIEYIGTTIRNEVANRREKIYEEQNRGIYMFRVNNEYVIDATLTGGLARYVNHSCAPNCVTEVVTCDKEDKIIIISSRRITKGEELTYDYQFDFEDDQHKIPCHCGAWNCRKWMN